MSVKLSTLVHVCGLFKWNFLHKTTTIVGNRGQLCTFGFGKRGLLEKKSFQKSQFSRDSRENVEILEIVENPQTVENKGESSHFFEILENLEILEVLEIPRVKRPLPQ